MSLMTTNAAIADGGGGGGADFYSGYNRKKVKEVNERLAKVYGDLGTSITEFWEGLVDTLQKNWVGPDEQDFETKFAERISKLFDNSRVLIDGAVDNMINLANSWMEFQEKNTISGETSDTTLTRIVKEVQLAVIPKIVEKRVRIFTDNDTLGLVDRSSANTISSSVRDFVERLRTRVNNLLEEVNGITAFSGEQSAHIRGYFNKLFEAFGEINTAVKDLDDALQILANSNYSASVDTIQSTLSQAGSDLTSGLSDLGSTRWGN